MVERRDLLRWDRRGRLVEIEVKGWPTARNEPDEERRAELQRARCAALDAKGSAAVGQPVTARWEAGKAAEFSVRERPDGLVVSGYASTWGQDRDGDVLESGAFDESLPRYLDDNPVLLHHHHPERAIGLIRRAFTDAIGLKVVAWIPRPEPTDEPWRRQAFKDVRDGVTRGLSMAGNFWRGIGKSVNHIRRVDLCEVSVVSVPSAYGAALGSKAAIRAAMRPENIEQIAERVAARIEARMLVQEYLERHGRL